jgi:hypothetical protein
MVCYATRVPGTPGHISRPRPWGALLLGLAIVGLIGLLPAHSQDPAPAGHPLDQPFAWLTEAKANYGNTVRDYTCTLVSRESVRGVLQEENVINFKMRTQPFSVAMRWLQPSKIKGQEVYFVLGHNNNRMRVKAPGITRVAGFVSVDPNDYRVTEHSRHNIYEAGLGNLIDQTLNHWAEERKISKTQVKVAEYNYNDRPCLRIETTRPDRRPEFYCHRSVLYLDKQSKLPLRNENYDWPRPGGDADGDLIEMFSYVNLQFNVGLTDGDFRR